MRGLRMLRAGIMTNSITACEHRESSVDG